MLETDRGTTEHDKATTCLKFTSMTTTYHDQ